MLAGQSDSALFLLGANHVTCPLEVRERLALPSADLERVLDELATITQEAVVLSTCHRIEVYALSSGSNGLLQSLLGSLSRWSGLDRPLLMAHSYRRWGEDAIRHLFEVSAGLDSVILGEGQVLGQVRVALDNALTFGAAGPVLSALFEHAVSAGKRVRGETSVAEKDGSLSRAAVNLVRQTIGDLRDKRALIIGTGKIGSLAAVALREFNVGQIDLVNRNSTRALNLASSVRGRALQFATLEDALASCDFVISCTSTADPVIQHSQVQEIMERRTSPLLIVDLAVPRDVEPSVAEIDGVRLFDVDSLRRPSCGLTSARERELTKARAVVAEVVEEFKRWLREREVISTVSSLYSEAERIRAGELVRAGSKLNGLSDEQRNAVEAATRSIVKKLLHRPATKLKRAAREGNGHEYEQLLVEMFALPERPGTH